MNNILGVSYPGVLHPVVSHGASKRLTEADQNWIQCRLMLILMLMFMTMVYIDDDADVDVDGVVMVVADVDHYHKN